MVQSNTRPERVLKVFPATLKRTQKRDFKLTTRLYTKALFNMEYKPEVTNAEHNFLKTPCRGISKNKTNRHFIIQYLSCFFQFTLQFNLKYAFKPEQRKKPKHPTVTIRKENQGVATAH